LKKDNVIGKSTKVKEIVKCIIKFEKNSKKNVQPCKIKIEKNKVNTKKSREIKKLPCLH
jgi:hypothetical protein